MSNFSRKEQPAAPVKILEWIPEYSVHVPQIDVEHQGLFAALNRLHQAMLAGKGVSILGTLIAELSRYVVDHFAHEEELMVTSHYPGLQAHVQQHEVLQRRATALRERFDHGELTMTIELTLFLSEWLRTHTMTTDRRFGEYLNESGKVSASDPAAGPSSGPGNSGGPSPEK